MIFQVADFGATPQKRKYKRVNTNSFPFFTRLQTIGLHSRLYYITLHLLTSGLMNLRILEQGTNDSGEKVKY